MQDEAVKKLLFVLCKQVIILIGRAEMSDRATEKFINEITDAARDAGISGVRPEPHLD